ncbi:MAG: response regulator transcription factor [Dysgonamonadaceae bacterium]|jgi:DNA-binding response OmpR family regulator|nr:response regulator transcription factor [Dysgonamonadaceae bacterium]
MIKLLLIEDDTNLSYIIKSSLEEIVGDYEVSVATNGEEGFSMLETVQPDIIVSDIEMPVLNGWDMVKKIRQTDTEIPIIFATAKISSKDVMAGYGAGGNNYIKKPFSPEELDAHIQSLMHLKSDKKLRLERSSYQIGKYIFTPQKNLLAYDSAIQKLTVRESQILELFIKDKGEVLNRKDILMHFWKTDNIASSRSLDVFITKLRAYLSKDSAVSINNIRGAGLILNVN